MHAYSRDRLKDSISVPGCLLAGKMSSPDRLEEPDPAASSSTSALPPAAPRPIYSFWGSNPTPSTQSAPPPKRRRRKADDATGDQAQLLVSGTNGAAWGLGKAPVSGASGRSKERKIVGEEAERKEMAKKARRGAVALRKSQAEGRGALSGLDAGGAADQGDNEVPGPAEGES